FFGENDIKVRSSAITNSWFLRAVSAVQVEGVARFFSYYAVSSGSVTLVQLRKTSTGVEEIARRFFNSSGAGMKKHTFYLDVKVGDVFAVSGNGVIGYGT